MDDPLLLTWAVIATLVSITFAFSWCRGRLSLGNVRRERDNWKMECRGLRRDRELSNEQFKQRAKDDAQFRKFVTDQVFTAVLSFDEVQEKVEDLRAQLQELRRGLTTGESEDDGKGPS